MKKEAVQNLLKSMFVTSLLLMGCHTTKNVTSKESPSLDTLAKVNPQSTPIFSLAKSTDGIYQPGEEELKAIQRQYNETTLKELNDGYILYAKGACINCHKAQNIYTYSEFEWKGIINDMASRANISDVEKDAVYKYVLAIKATQVKGN